MSNETPNPGTWDGFIKKHGRKPVSFNVLGAVMDQVFVFCKQMNAKNIERNTRLDGLEARIAAIESEPRALSYAGTFQENRTFEKNTAVTHRGSLWVSVRATSGEPGSDDSGWLLACKRGRDGKDLR